MKFCTDTLKLNILPFEIKAKFVVCLLRAF